MQLLYREIKKNNDPAAANTAKQQDLYEFQEFVFIATEEKKADYGTSIRDQYMEKILMYGFIMV